MRPTQCVGGLHLTVADSLAPLPLNNNKNNNFFRRFPFAKNKKGLRKSSTRFLEFSYKIPTVQKIVLSSSRGQGDFRGLQASRPRPRTSKCVLENVIEAKEVLENSTSGTMLFFIWTNSITKFIPKMLGYKREMYANKGLNNLIFSIGFQIVKIQFFEMALKTCKM